MRNYYAQIYEYLDKLVRSIIILDKTGIRSKGISLSLTDIIILKLVGEASGKKMFEVIDALSMDRNTFKTIINRLILQGYISKSRSEEDKRAYFLELTAKGREIFEDIIDQEKQLLFSLLNDFTFNEEKAILKFLVKLEMLHRQKK